MTLLGGIEAHDPEHDALEDRLRALLVSIEQLEMAMGFAREVELPALALSYGAKFSDHILNA